MAHKVKFLALAIFILWSIPVIAADSQYVLPEPDGGSTSPSPPCFDGNIQAISADSVTFKARAGATEPKEIQALVTTETVIFTVYGGYVSPTELKVGQKAHIWYKGQSCSKPILPIQAARIELASMNPSDDWP